MRRTVQNLAKCSALGASLALLGLSVAAPATAGDQIYRVDLNKTQIVRLPGSAGSIVIGNPAIADISVQSPNTVFVVGRGYGETNLIVLDRAGNTMMDADIQVTAVTPSHGVRVFNGSERSSYSCAPYCQPSPILGDDPGFIGENSGAAKPTGNASVMDNAPPPETLVVGAPTTNSQPSFESSGFPRSETQR